MSSPANAIFLKPLEGIRFLNEGIRFLNCDWACLRASSSGSLFLLQGSLGSQYVIRTGEVWEL